MLSADWTGVGCSFSRGSAQEGGELRAWTRVRHVEDFSSWEEASWDLKRLGRSEEGVPRQPLRLQAQCPRGVPGSRSQRRRPAEMLTTLWVQGQSAFGSEGEAAGPWLKRGHQEGSG